MPVFNAKLAMWSRKQSVCSGVSVNSRCEDPDCVFSGGVKFYPFAVALRIRVSQIVCGIGGMVIGAVGWLEEREDLALGLGVPTGGITILAAALSIYYSRGFSGWSSARSNLTKPWGVPWRALGPSPCAAVPLTILWTLALMAHVGMFCFCIKSLINIGHTTSTNAGVAGAQLFVSFTTLALAMYMVYLDLSLDSSLSPPPRNYDAHTSTAVSMVPLTSVALATGNSGDGATDQRVANVEKEQIPPDQPS